MWVATYPTPVNTFLKDERIETTGFALVNFECVSDCVQAGFGRRDYPEATKRPKSVEPTTDAMPATTPRRTASQALHPAASTRRPNAIARAGRVKDPRTVATIRATPTPGMVAGA